jgi:hypothetical protein
MVILLLTNYNNGHIIFSTLNIEIKHIDYSKCSYILIAEDGTFSGLEIFVKNKSKQGETMKIITLIVTIVLFYGCPGGVIGSENNETIDHVDWSIGTTENPAGYSYTNQSLQVTGMITNTGDTTILAPWSVEAEFYSDSTFTLILGGDQQSFNVNLQSGVSIQWTLSYSDPDKVEFESYPYFAIDNFRAFISKN